MNQMRYDNERKSHKTKKSSRSAGKRIGILILRLFLYLLLCGAVAGVCGAAGVLSACIDDAPSISEINISPSGFATFIYDSEGNLLQKLTSSNSNRTAVSIDNVPVSLQRAVIAIEDERFYQHNGIDLKGIVRAVYVGIKNKLHFTEGASTITQQLLKNNVFVNWTSENTFVDKVKRKIQEQYLAIMLEKKLQNKNLILENYLNTINLGAGTYGVEAAAKKYFNKDVWELTLSESTVLAGITQNPTRYNPIRHPENNAERRERILTKMVEQGYITEAEKSSALADNVYDRITEAQQTAAEADTVYSYFVDALTDAVVSDLQTKKGCTEVQAYQLLYSGGLRIYTTQDSTIQNICDEEFSDPSNFPTGTTYSLDWALTVTHENGETENYSKEMLLSYYRRSDSNAELLFSSEDSGNKVIEQYKASILSDTDKIIAERTTFSPQPQSSLIILDQYTGYVKAIEGGRGKKTASLTLNRAVDSYRQPGSTFKILSTYAAALDSGIRNLASIINDEPYQYSDGTEVKNADGSYRGWITLREAIVKSVNIAAVKTIQEITPAAAYEQLLKFGFTSISPTRDVYEPLALGGISKGVSNLELTSAFGAIANNGTRISPIFYTKIYDQNGNLILDNEPDTRVSVSPATAWELTSAMEDVVKEGTGTALQLSCGMPTAGKTGTTNDYRNVWFVGYTPYYTMGIWAGYDNNDPLPDEDIYRTYHKTLWNKIMNRISEKQLVTEFKMPSGVTEADLCGISGQLAGYDCEYASHEYIASIYCPTDYCMVCGDGYDDKAEPDELIFPESEENSDQFLPDEGTDPNTPDNPALPEDSDHQDEGEPDWDEFENNDPDTDDGDDDYTYDETDWDDNWQDDDWQDGYHYEEGDEFVFPTD